MTLSETLTIQQTNKYVFIQRLFIEKRKLMNLENDYMITKEQLSELQLENPVDKNRVKFLQERLKQIRVQIHKQRRFIQLYNYNNRKHITHLVQ